MLADAAEKAGLPRGLGQLVPGTDRASVGHLLRARGLVDLIIPRGGAGLISYVVENATVPVIETGVGNVHVYVDAARRPRHGRAHRHQFQDVAGQRVQLGRDAAGAPWRRRRVPAAHHDRVCRRAGVTVHGDERFAARDGVEPADDDDWAREYLSLDMAARVVDDVDEAIAHIRRWSSGHTEAIVTRDLTTARRFVARVDSAAVMVNASTRFTDGGEFGFGAEIGISTQKMHARGPMGLPELTSTKWIVTGDGQLR